MFKQFFWKIVLCIVPVLLSLWAIAYAYRNDRFKLGVDLVGGTILVYEIDTRKLISEEGRERQDPATIAKDLAEKLKNRIDPNDLYNVVIRPAGGEGRVEIILPTGGHANAEQHQKRWDELQREMEKQYQLNKDELKVPRGQISKLTDKILQLVQEQKWTANLFNTPESRKELMALALDPTIKDKGEPQYLRPLFEEFTRERKQMADRAVVIFEVGWSGPLNVAPFVASTKMQGYTAGRIIDHYNPATNSLFDAQKSLPKLMEDVKQRVDDNRKNREIESWFKQQAWHRMIGLMLEEFPVLKDRKAAFERIAPDAVEELVGRATCKGDSVGQAYLTVMDAWVKPSKATAEDNTSQALRGSDYSASILADKYVDNIPLDDKESNKFISASKVLEFIAKNYGPSAHLVQEKIDAVYRPNKENRDLTVEEVQRVKELVLKVGSLEFRILANNVDDKAAIEEAKAMFASAGTNAALKAELEDAQNSGLPPPPPRVANSKIPKVFDIKLHGGDCKVTYSWVELGPQERQQLHLNNTAVEEGFSQAWSEMAKLRDAGQAGPISAGGDLKMMQGALFYSRACLDRNLPEEERQRKKYEYFVLTRNPEIDPQTQQETPRIDGRYLTHASNQADSSGRPAVSFGFNATGGQLFREVTRKNVPSGEEGSTQIKRHLAIILDGLVQSAPTINSEISTSGQISGSFSNREVDQLVKVLRSGALPATLKPQPVSENTMGASLGQDTISKGLFAIGISFLAVLVFMIVYYRFAGVVASVALLVNLVLTVGFMVAVQATFTLPGLAGLVLMLGMAVDANILIYERLREERERGASILLALRNGYDRAFGTIIDTHLSSIFTAVVLYIVGNDQLKGFGVSLTLGLLISLFTSLFMTRLIFDIWAAMGWLKKLSMLRLFAKPDIDFMSVRYIFFAVTAILTVLGAALFIGRLPNDLDIDFVGGTAYSGQLTEAKTIEDLRNLLDKDNQTKLLKARVQERDEAGNRYVLQYETAGGKLTPPREVILANRPEGVTPDDRAKNVEKRAGDLPDWAVEQIFLSSSPEGESKEYKSRFFTVRTTEKEPDLVQATLDRLLQDKDGNTLLQQVTMRFDAPDETAPLKGGREVRVKFFKENKATKQFEPDSASPSFVSTLLMRQLLDVFGEKERDKLPFTFELSNEDADPSGDGRFKVAEIAFIPKAGSLKDDEIVKVNQALVRTKSEFEVRPQPERLETFDSQLAAEIRLRAMYAVLLSWAAILMYLWFRFGSWTFGLAAVLCLIHDLFFTLGIIAVCHYVNLVFPGFLGIEDFKINLPAVAAFLTLVGYSVNDTIVVFDRIREIRGKNPDLTPQMINDSVNQTLSRTLLASLTTWLVVIVLYVAGGPGVHLFAFVMVVGVLVGTYSSIYVASPLLLLFGEGNRSSARSPSSGPAPMERGPDVRIQPVAP